MAKSLRSKIKRRYRKAKRQYIDETVVKNRVEQCYTKIQNTLRGISSDKPRPKNAFLHPDNPEAIFPRGERVRPIDFRCEALPLAGLAASGCRRQYEPQEVLELGLVVHSIDGYLDLEKRMMDSQQNNSWKSLSLSGASTSLPVSRDHDEQSLMTCMSQVCLADSTPKDNAEETELQRARKHQDRVAGRRATAQRPVLKNRLASKSVA